MSIAFSVLWAEPLRLLATVLAIVSIKIVILFVLASLFRMHLGDRLLVAILISQAGEFAFVVLQFAQSADALPQVDYDLLVVAVALTMMTTPVLLLLFDRLVAPRLDARGDRRTGDTFDEHRKIVVLGYGRFGQIVTRMLRAQGFDMTLIDDDPAQIELVRRFGSRCFTAMVRGWTCYTLPASPMRNWSRLPWPAATVSLPSLAICGGISRTSPLPLAPLTVATPTT
jgi:glutathione-regulated potassium-efflux system ancillary protein KefC